MRDVIEAKLLRGSVTVEEDPRIPLIPIYIQFEFQRLQFPVNN